MSAAKRNSGAIQVRLEASGLSDEAVEQINTALQRTLVTQLADMAVMKGGRIDLGLPGDDRFRDILGDLGGTRGIVAEFPRFE
jgi:hypothetical protein